ncbi:hypothetical protein Mapa_008727 [Marchantia paleacea]|nr:hypothetical protein Mapa_008727 [Marchantia paleacea]
MSTTLSHACLLSITFKTILYAYGLFLVLPFRLIQEKRSTILSSIRTPPRSVFRFFTGKKFTPDLERMRSTSNAELADSTRLKSSSNSAGEAFLGTANSMSDFNDSKRSLERRSPSLLEVSCSTIGTAPLRLGSAETEFSRMSPRPPCAAARWSRILQLSFLKPFFALTDVRGPTWSLELATGHAQKIDATEEARE